MRNRLRDILAVAGLAAVLGGGVAAAGTIDVQFGATGMVFGPTPQYSGAAVTGGASDQWNFVGGTFNPDYLTSTLGWGRTITNQPLFDVAGAATGASLSLTTPDAFISLAAFNPFFKSTAYADLMDSFVFADGNRLGNGPGADGAGLVTLSGLNAGGLYELILLSSGDVVGRATRFTLDGVDKVATPTGIGTFAQGDNYVTFLAAADAGGSLSFTFDAGSGIEGNLNGLQLIELRRPEIDGSPTPEPGTWALMILGFGAVGGVMRARRGGLESRLPV